MKRLLMVFLAGLLMTALAVPAMAWEFNVKGEYELRLRYYGRAGETDLFGVAPLQDTLAGTWVGFAGPTWYNRGAVGAIAGDTAQGNVRITRGGYSRWQSDAFLSDSRLTLEPEFRVNPAIRVHGVYTVGGYRNKYFQNVGAVGLPPFERYYMSQVSMNAYDTGAVPSWEQFRATIQMPWGIFSIGLKDFPFGTGATLAYNTRAEAWLTVLPYGPFRFLHGIWLARGRLGGFESWANMPDSGRKNTLFQGILMTYDVATLNFGAGAIWRMAHLNRAEALLTLGSNGADINDLIGVAFLKYNNGRFFAAAEYATIQADIYRLGASPRYVEAYHWHSELGAVSGPAKLRLLYCLASGYVLNNNNVTKSYRPWALNYQAMKPYQFLMFETFAGGNNGGWRANDVTFVSDDHGQMTDAYCYAARLDYAVACNLNIWGSYIWAHRLERAGFYAGGFDSSGADGNATIAAAQAWKAANTGGAAAGLNPYVDDGYIGWEMGVGADWKLLENLNMHVQYNYWQPGEWFDQAYQTIGLRNGAYNAAALTVGRSAIQSIQGSFMINF